MTSTDTALRLIVEYLSETDRVDGVVSDVVIGFGMFDLALPRFCGDVYTRGLAPRIVLTGGIGAGTGNLGGREADVWRETLRQTHPAIPDAHILVENQSTNTGENVEFTTGLLARQQPALVFGASLRRVLLVASPTRMRRVALTFRRHHPRVHVARCLPPFDIASDRALYAAQGIDYAVHVLGELDRIERYAACGWIVADHIPPEIDEARAILGTPGR